MTGNQIDILINQISKLPGLGRKSAQRIALYLLNNKEQSLSPLISSLKVAREKILNCEKCNNIDTVSPCSICSSPKRDKKSICVVEDVSDLWAFERIGLYDGLYQVLGGTLSAINGIGFNEINLNKLEKRIHDQKVKEVILALSTTTEGQTTSHVIAEKLESLNIEVTRLAQGVPIGGEVHYLDENTLNAAFQSRKKIV
mgnify:CR=1 FL=1|tara:strand:- start:896 stop:1492 length:597 start_codon:yes stop_codon:yes gene_type:complete